MTAETAAYQLATRESQLTYLSVGDRVGRSRWTVKKVTATDGLVVALGENSRGERFALSGKPTKVVRVWG